MGKMKYISSFLFQEGEKEYIYIYIMIYPTDDKVGLSSAMDVTACES
jgi:hypothetical protein